MLYIPCPLAGEGCWTLFGKTPFNLLNYLTLNIMLPLNVLAACRVMGLIANKVFLRELHKKRHDGQSRNPGAMVGEGEQFLLQISGALVIAAILIGSFL